MNKYIVIRYIWPKLNRMLNKSAFTTLAAACIFSTAALSQTTVAYNVLPTSSLTISGNSNVNKFACELKNNFKEGLCQLEATFEKDKLKLNGAILEIEVMNLDCSNRKMDEDLQCALKSDVYPGMFLNILEINYSGSLEEVLKSACTSSIVEITIAGTTKKAILNFNHIQYSGNMLSFKGAHQIDMLDFSIEPPQVLWGLIKVDGVINIDFELRVKINQGS